MRPDFYWDKPEVAHQGLLTGAFACSRRAFVPDKLPAFIALIKANPQDPAYIQDHRREAGVTLAFRAMERRGWDRQFLRFPFNTIPHRPLRCKNSLTGSTRALRKSRVLNVTDVWKSAGQQSRNCFWKIKFAQCCQLQNSIVCQKFGVHTVTLGDLLYAIQTCNLCSCRYVALRLDAHCVVPLVRSGCTSRVKREAVVRHAQSRSPCPALF